MKKHPKMTEDQRIKNKETQNLPHVREKKSKTLKEVMNRSDVKEKLRTASKLRWSKPEEHEKTSKSVKKALSDPCIRTKYETAFREFWELNGEEHTRRMKEIFNRPETIQKHRGSNNGRWNGGTSFEPYCEKFNNDLKNRVRKFFDYSCVICGKSQEENGQKLSVHHVSYDKHDCCNDNYPKFAALCKSCHTKTNNSRKLWEYMLSYIIYEVYEGKSFIPKGE